MIFESKKIIVYLSKNEKNNRVKNMIYFILSI